MFRVQVRERLHGFKGAENSEALALGVDHREHAVLFLGHQRQCADRGIGFPQSGARVQEIGQERVAFPFAQIQEQSEATAIRIDDQGGQAKTCLEEIRTTQACGATRNAFGQEISYPERPMSD